MEDRSVLEFYLVRGDRPSLIAVVVSDAPPPLVGQLVNITRQDYRVFRVDYSIDKPTAGPTTYRRNVMMRVAG